MTEVTTISVGEIYYASRVKDSYLDSLLPSIIMDGFVNKFV